MKTIICLAAAFLFPAAAVAQDAHLTVQQRIGIAVGPIIVDAAALAVQVEELQRQIADLKRVNEQLTDRLNKPPPPPADRSSDSE